jgi:hypothetical protein
VITGTRYVRYAEEEWPGKSLVVVGGRGDQEGIHIDRVKAVIGQRSTLQTHAIIAVIRVIRLGEGKFTQWFPPIDNYRHNNSYVTDLATPYTGNDGAVVR